MDVKLEMVPLPVTDVDRAKTFYADQLGWHCDVDHHASDEFRVVQFTPPGSACSVSFGIGVAHPDAGPVRGLTLVVRDIEAARDDLVGRGVEVSEIRHMTAEGWQRGVDPTHRRFNSFADLTDPDGNTFVLQEVDHPAEPRDAVGPPE